MFGRRLVFAMHTQGSAVVVLVHLAFLARCVTRIFRIQGLQVAIGVYNKHLPIFAKQQNVLMLGQSTIVEIKLLHL